MPKRVVDGLEVIQVDVKDSPDMIPLRGLRKCNLQSIQQHPAIRQIGELIVEGEVLDPVFRNLAFRDVLFDRHVVRNCTSGIANGRNDGALDILTAVLSPVVEITAPRLPLLQRRPERSV